MCIRDSTNSQTLLALEGNLFWLILAVVFCLPLARIASQQITAAAAVSRPRQIILGILVPVMNLGILLICTAMLSGQSYNPFLYYRCLLYTSPPHTAAVCRWFASCGTADRPGRADVYKRQG